MKKIALVELGGSHDECLYSQLLFLKSKEGINVDLFVNEKLKNNVQDFTLSDAIHFVKTEGILDLWRVKKCWSKEKYDLVIFNTAQGSLLKKLFLIPFFNHPKFYGTLHNVAKLKSSKGQQLISKYVNGYFVLNDQLKLKAKGFSSKSFTTFYPIFFPSYDRLNKKPDHETWILVPGQVEKKRRDYSALFKSISIHGIDSSIKFVFLGKSKHKHGDGDWVDQKISELKCGDSFITWDNFIAVNDYHSWIQECDYILPLIHNEHQSGKLYIHQTSGSYNLGHAYQLPFLLPSSFKGQEDWVGNSLFYDSIDNIMVLINRLSSSDKGQFSSPKKFSFDYQRQNYLSALGLDLM